MTRSDSLVALCYLLAGCGAETYEPARTEPDKTNSHVLLIRADDSPPAQRVRDAFVRHTDYEVTEMPLHGGAFQADIVAAAEALHPAVIVALGENAASLTRHHFPQTPLVYALNQGAEDLGTQAWVAGISGDVDPGTEFTMYQLVLGKLDHVTVFYASSKPPQHALRAQAPLRMLGIQLHVVAWPEDAATLAHHVSDADATWLLDDPALMSDHAMMQLQTAAETTGKPLLASAPAAGGAAHALMAYDLNYENIGAQAAMLVAESVQQGCFTGGPGLRAPVGGYLALNTQAAGRLGIALTADTKSFTHRRAGEPH